MHFLGVDGCGFVSGGGPTIIIAGAANEGGEGANSHEREEECFHIEKNKCIGHAKMTNPSTTCSD